MYTRYMLKNRYATSRRSRINLKEIVLKLNKNLLALLIMSGAAAHAETSLLEATKKNGCTACHAVDKKLLGPSFVDVANRYRADAKAPEKLVAKIKSGGGGVWGAIPMPPQAASKEEVTVMVNQILALKK